MPVHNSDIAQLFNKTADLLEIKGENRFRVRAYRDAARTIESLSQNAADMIDNGKDLSELSGIGRDLAGKISDIVRNKKFKLLEDLKKEVPEELAELMNISNLGPKRVASLYHELDIKSFKDLQKALDEGRIKDLEGFGEKMQQQIAGAVRKYENRGPARMKLIRAEEIIKPFYEYLGESKGVKDLTIAGSYRRRKETVGDIDILATCKKGSDIMDRFAGYDEVENVVSKGGSKSTVILRSGLQVDLRVMAEVSYGAAMVYFTGSKEHNIAIRKIGVSKKYKINEYGIFKKEDKRVAGKTEQEVYEKIGLKWIPPELRENRGEVEAAKKKGALPNLVEPDDIKGDLHCHSKYTDGRASIEEMGEAAKKMGYDYIAMTDHSQKVTVAGGLDEKRLRKQLEEIDKINDKLRDFTILKGCEVDILEDGGLDLPDEVLDELDMAVCSVHSKFNLSRDEQTRRVIKAMDNPRLTILGHPTGRLINEREAYEIDIEKVIKAAAERGVFLELNCHPERLDLNDIHCKAAKEAGVKIVLSTDSHRTSDLDHMRFGIYQARRGWVEKKDVVNTHSLSTLKKMLAGRK